MMLIGSTPMKPARKISHPAIDAHFRANPIPLSPNGVTAWGIYRVPGPGLVLRTAISLLPVLGGERATLVIDRGLN